MRWLRLVVLTVFVTCTIGKKSRNTNQKDYNKILEEYLLRNFDGGSRDGGSRDGGSRDVDIEVEEEASGGSVGRVDEDVIIEVGSGDEESEIEEDSNFKDADESNIVDEYDSNIEDEDDNNIEDDYDSNIDDEDDSNIEDEDDNNIEDEDDNNIEDEDDSNIEDEDVSNIEDEDEDDDIGSGDEEEENTILNSAPYSMASIDGETTVNIILQQFSTSDLLNMVCDVSSENSDLFVESNCVPEIYMVSGLASCSSLPAEVSAKKLADVHGEGVGELFVEATWSELPGKCLVMLKPKTCEDEGTGIGEVLDIGEEESNGGDNKEVEGDISESSEKLRSSRDIGILRNAGLGRSYGTITLSGFTLLSTGSSSVFTVSVPSIPVFGGVISGIVSTPYDKFSTLPYLQLPGWTATDAFLIAISMLVLYYSYAYVNAEAVSLAPLKRKLFNTVQIARVDALQGGLSAVAETYLLSMANPWKNILENINRNLLKKSNTEYVNKNKFVKKSGRPFSSSPKLVHKAGWFGETEGWQQSWQEQKNAQMQGDWHET